MYECAHWDKFIKTKNKRKKRNAKKVLFCNLPWNMGVKNNIGKEFLMLVDMFKNTPQGKYINRHTVKLSYSTMRNLKSHLSSSNMKKINPNQTSTLEPCKCDDDKNIQWCSLENE